jgi:hypothetical protein
VKKGTLLAVIVMMAVPALTEGQGRSREEQRRRDQIRLMEGALVQAVRIGAEQVSSELEKFEPAGVTMLSGTPRARGFVLDAYGVFFDVEIPSLNQSLVWSILNSQRERQTGDAISSLQSFVESTPNGPGREQALQALRRVAKTVGPVSPRSPGVPPRGQVSAAAAAKMPNPDELYTDAVKDKLVNVMLTYSLDMNLGPEEWLTVAARGSDGPLPQAGLSDSITIVMRVNGSDLSIYHADKARREEIVKKVKDEAKVF